MFQEPFPLHFSYYLFSMFFIALLQLEVQNHYFNSILVIENITYNVETFYRG